MLTVSARSGDRRDRNPRSRLAKELAPSIPGTGWLLFRRDGAGRRVRGAMLMTSAQLGIVAG